MLGMHLSLFLKIDEIKAKEAALEDTFDVCKKAYRNKTINLSSYLDSIRELSEEQFLNLAMRQKNTFCSPINACSTNCLNNSNENQY